MNIRFFGLLLAVPALLNFSQPGPAKTEPTSTTVRSSSAFGPPAFSAPLAIGPHEFTVDGVRLWYRVAGPDRDTPIIFLHGGPGEGSQTFQAVGGPAIEKSHRMVYFDQRGSGRSERPKDSAAYSLDILVEDIERLRQHLGVSKIALLGHSFGTILALEYAVKYPDHTKALILAAAVPDWIGQQHFLCAQLQRSDPEAYTRAVAAAEPGSPIHCLAFRAYSGSAGKNFVYGNMFPDRKVGDRVDELDNENGLGNSGEMNRALFSKGLLIYRFEHPERVVAPVLVIAGGKDHQAVIELQRGLAARLPNARLIEYPDNGHFMFVEDPERFARDVNKFMDSMSPSRSIGTTRWTVHARAIIGPP